MAALGGRPEPSRLSGVLSGELVPEVLTWSRRALRDALRSLSPDLVVFVTARTYDAGCVPPGADVVLDFVGEAGTPDDGVAMTRDAGSYFVIGYGGRVDVPTIDIISREINVIGNLVGSYNELAELMVLAQTGKVTLHTKAYPLDEAPQALHDLDSGLVRGRAILVP